MATDPRHQERQRPLYYGYAEIAEALGVTPGAVASGRGQRAMSELTDHRHGSQIHQHADDGAGHRHRGGCFHRCVRSAAVYPYYTWAGRADEARPYAVVVVNGPPLASGYGDMDIVTTHPSLRAVKARLRKLAATGAAVSGDRRAEAIYRRTMR